MNPYLVDVQLRAVNKAEHSWFCPEPWCGSFAAGTKEGVDAFAHQHTAEHHPVRARLAALLRWLGDRLAVAFIVITWAVSTTCVPSGIAFWDLYIDDCTGLPCVAIGYRVLPAHTATMTFGTGKDMTGCALGWMVEAVNADGSRAPEECQPTGFAQDGIAWEGM